MIKSFIKPFVPEFIMKLRTDHLSLKPVAMRKCTICNYHGWFGRFGRPPRVDAQCPNCGSLERHRLLMLAVAEDRVPMISAGGGGNVLHFAAEPFLEKILREKFENYSTADFYRNADLKLNIENIDAMSDSFDLVIANHVLEHVDDLKATKEIWRVLKPGGFFLCMVPIVEGWKKTYENSSVTTPEDRQLHFGQSDHLRYYGHDFRERVISSGLKLNEEITAEGKDVADFGLNRGEKIFVFSKVKK
jgi:SAM-dependent methyltransferase